MQLPLPEGVIQLRKLTDTSDRTLKLGLVQLQPSHECLGQTVLLSPLTIILVCRNDGISVAAKRVRHRQQGVTTLFVAGLTEIHGGPAQPHRQRQKLRSGIWNGLHGHREQLNSHHPA